MISEKLIWWIFLLLSVIAAAKSDDVCMTPICIEESARVLSLMNEEVDPCDDFYEFACGKFLKETVIPADKTAHSTFSIIKDRLNEHLRAIFSEPIKRDEIAPFQDVKKLYKACMNEELVEERGAAPMEDKLNAMGGWPVVVGDSWDKDSWTWQQAVAESGRNGFPVGYFISLDIVPNFPDTTTNILKLNEADLRLNHDHLLKQMNDSIVEAYHSYQVDLAVMFGAERARAEVEMREVLEFEFELAAISDLKPKINPKKISVLQEYYNYTDWLPYLNDILPQEAQLVVDNSVDIGDPKYFLDLFELINITPKRTLANYVKWRQAFLAVRFMPKEFKKRLQVYTEAITGKTSQDPRWFQCVLTVTKYYPVAVGALYVRKHFEADAKKNALEMVNNIKAEFVEILKETDWMDDKTKKGAIKKALKMTEKIGFADELLDDAKIEEFYVKTPANVSEFEYFESVLSLKAAKAYGEFRKLQEPAAKGDWTEDMPPATINAFYHILDNVMVFPAAILQGAFFNAERPQYMNYGAIGFFIGHEITHGFDDTGCNVNSEGKLKYWWAVNTRLAFMKKVKCIAGQYSEFTEPLTNLKVDGLKTQGENIADNGGVKEAYHAYIRWSQNNTEPKLPGLKYSPQQMFWIATGQLWCDVTREETMKSLILTDEHSPGRFRVIGPLSNRKEFADDFQCNVGSKMNPEKKCQVW